MGAYLGVNGGIEKWGGGHRLNLEQESSGAGGRVRFWLRAGNKICWEAQRHKLNKSVILIYG